MLFYKRAVSRIHTGSKTLFSRVLSHSWLMVLVVYYIFGASIFFYE